MSSLLVRDIDEETKHALAVRAAQNSRSQQAEALDILRRELGTEKDRNWMQMLYDSAREVGGVQLDLPERHAPRFTGMLVQMPYLVDTNVVSELMIPQPNLAVVQWMKEHGDESRISSITIEELRYGVLFLPEGKQKRKLASSIDALIETYRSSTWSFDAEAAEQCAQFHVFAVLHGRTPSLEDLMIASIAKIHDAPVVTRNVKDFSYLGIDVVNPFPSNTKDTV